MYTERDNSLRQLRWASSFITALQWIWWRGIQVGGHIKGAGGKSGHESQGQEEQKAWHQRSGEGHKGHAYNMRKMRSTCKYNRAHAQANIKCVKTVDKRLMNIEYEANEEWTSQKQLLAGEVASVVVQAVDFNFLFYFFFFLIFSTSWKLPKRSQIAQPTLQGWGSFLNVHYCLSDIKIDRNGNICTGLIQLVWCWQATIF